MPLEIKILTGSRAGQTARFEQSTVVVGRNQEADLRFDPQKDLDVSGRHAELHGVAGGCELRDVGSTNGTFVNGTRVSGSVKLKSGDRIRFGGGGPEVEVTLRATGGVKAGSTEERVAIAVKKQTAGLRRLLVAAIVVVAVGLAAAYYIGQRAATQQVERLKQQLAENDARVRALQNGMPGDTALAKELERRLTSLRNRLTGATRDAERDTISREIAEIEGRMAGIIRMDLPSINARNAPGVALLISEIGETRFAGTAFAITPQGLMLTNRHNVRDEDRRVATRLAIKFRNDSSYLRAHVVKVSDTADVDLALIQLDDVSDPVPTITGLQAHDDNATEGASVAIIGFPLGYETAQEGEGERFVAKTTLIGGTVSKRTTSVLQIDSFAAHGSSGSPVLSARGLVVGVVWGGPADAGGRIVYAVPLDRIIAFLPPEARSAVKN